MTVQARLRVGQPGPGLEGSDSARRRGPVDPQRHPSEEEVEDFLCLWPQGEIKSKAPASGLEIIPPKGSRIIQNPLKIGMWLASYEAILTSVPNAPTMYTPSESEKMWPLNDSR
ncbi:hypothetical protein R1flu_012458 [Riccia fluitans]|uniref:Uncharacterized protein n=1 Tax=Riccia fluitans TaxID=41844 RepID=A0ABD1ZAN8_9MARC